MYFNGDEPQKMPSTRRRRHRKSLGPNREQLLQKYQKELKQLLSHKTKKQQQFIEPLRSQLFLDWGDKTTSKRKLKNKKKTSPVRSQQPNTQEMTKCAQRLSNHPNYKYRQSDELIVNRYSTSVEPMSHLVKRPRGNSKKLHVKNYTTIDSSNANQITLLPALKEKTEKIKILVTGREEIDRSQTLGVEVQGEFRPRRRLYHFAQGLQTVSDYRPSRRRKQVKSFDLNTLESNSKPSDSQENILFRSDVRDKNMKFNNSIEDNKEERSEFTVTQNLTDLAKKTIFYKKIINEKQVTKEALTAVCKKYRKPTVMPTKQALPEFINNYVSLDPTFDFKQILQQPTFTILRFRDSLYLGQAKPVEQGRHVRHGRGVFISPKAHFEGQLQNGEKKYGMQLTEQGVYKGQFSQNQRNGKGEFRWHNGQYYNGQWSCNKKHGSGIWTSSVSPANQIPDSYMGEWDHGNVHGYGVHTWNNGRSKYQGEFKNFLKHGRGVEKFQNGDRYQGHYKDGKADGYGEYFWKDGSFYKGNFVAGLRQGAGVWQQLTNDRYQGFLKQDCKHGTGIMYYSNGDIFEGTFVMNMRQGPGKLILASSGDIINGIWTKNELITQL